MTIKTNLINKRFGRLTVIAEQPSDKNGRAQWLCQCDCGSTKITAGKRLINGGVESCGCLQIESVLKRAKHDPRESSARGPWRSNYKEDGLTIEQFMEISQKNCFYCGIPPKNGSNIRWGTKNVNIEEAQFTYNGLDRYDNTKGHTYENCVPCCWTCNVAKSDMTVEEFYAWRKKVYDNLVRKGVITPGNKMI